MGTTEGSRYSFAIGLIAQRKDLKNDTWYQVKPESLGDLFSRSVWIKHWPLRITVHAKTKAGVADSYDEFVRIMQEINTKSNPGYATEKQLAESPAPKTKAPREDWLKQVLESAK